MAKSKKKPEPEPTPVGVAVSRGTVSEAFLAWVKEKKSTVADEALGIVNDAFAEMFDLKVLTFRDWWLRNHYRYAKLREIERAQARRFAQSFLVDVSLGKVKL
jgi:hypothetical protein